MSISFRARRGLQKLGYDIRYGVWCLEHRYTVAISGVL